MNAQAHIDAEALVAEIARYLAAVEAFRAAGYEPSWRLELVPDEILATRTNALVAQSY
jgi:hypothetical protein